MKENSENDHIGPKKDNISRRLSRALSLEVGLPVVIDDADSLVDEMPADEGVVYIRKFTKMTAVEAHIEEAFT